ncbi:MAG: DUF1871 family protein [Oscillospiraceae bacterium]|nr:DUF1871 family protein [Oscillospiraceae bacterium]
MGADKEYFNRVGAIVRAYDPAGIIDICPEDEYNSEINMIIKAAYQAANAHELAERIYGVFQSAFGSGQTTMGINEYLFMAREIMKAFVE